MIRRSITILSLLGLLVSAGLLVVSFFNVACWGPHHRLFVKTGYFTWDYSRLPMKSIQREWEIRGWTSFQFRLRLRAPVEPTIQFPGFRLEKLSGSWMAHFNLAVATLLFVVIRVFDLGFSQHQRRRRRKLGQCVKCGYSLKGLTEPRCPECNTPYEPLV